MDTSDEINDRWDNNEWDEESESEAGMEQVPTEAGSDDEDSDEDHIIELPSQTQEKYEVKHFPGAGAGAPMNSSTTAQPGFNLYQQQLHGGSDNKFAPFASKLDWDVARWSKTHPISLSAIDQLLHIEGVRYPNSEPFSPF